MSLGLIGFIAALILLMVLVYKKINLVIVSLVCCMVVALTNEMSILDTLKNNYMAGFAEFITNNFLMFALSAIFGKVMEESGAAASFAKVIYRACGPRWAVYGVMAATALLVYGGVSHFVVVFAVFPVFLVVFREANLPIKLIPGVIYAAGATFAASMLPGTPTLNNLIPTQYLDTTPMSAPVIGIVTSIVTIILTVIYFEYEFKRAKKKNEVFVLNDKARRQMEKLEGKKDANPWLSVLPMVALVVCLNVFNLDILVSLVIAIIMVLIFFYKEMGNKSECITEGVSSAGSTIINTCSVVGFGSVVKGTAAFSTLIGSLMGLAGNPLISLGIIATIICGITGSGTGGIAIFMQMFAEKYLELGVNPEVMHRIVTIASTGLDSLPHNGLVITVILTCGCTHKESYKPIFVTSVLITLVALAIAIGMGVVMYPLGV